MTSATAIVRLLFIILSIFFFTAYLTSGEGGHTLMNLTLGGAAGSLLGAVLIGCEILFKKFRLRAFNTVLLGLFVGYLLGQALVLILDAILPVSAASLYGGPTTWGMVRGALILVAIYLGVFVALRSSDEIFFSIPLIKFSPATPKKRDLILDASVLADARILDVASSGIFDHSLVIPRFVVKELQSQAEIGDETQRGRAKKALEVEKKLAALPDLSLRYCDADFPEMRETINKLVQLARLMDANLFTADLNRVQIGTTEGVRIINLHALSNSLKPLMPAGEQMKIKVQRYGKEPGQGVGYLEDGTMVVINSGGQYIGETIDVRVLSVKHTTSGRMIFCNTSNEEEFAGRSSEEM